MSFDAPSLLDLGKIFGVPVAMYLMARFITRRDKTRDEAAVKTDKATQETSAERKLWREARLTSEKTLSDAIKNEAAERTKWQFENALDLERVVGILKEFVQVQQQIAVMATTTQHHAGEITRLHIRLEENAKHLNDFIMRHVKPSNS